jgi:ABC-type transport system involved in cytochrome c biogenesis permease subunit
MSEETFAHVSNLVIPTATVIYALAMIAHAMEWAMGRVVKAPAEQPAEVLVASSSAGVADVVVPAVAVAGAEGDGAEKAAAASRIGLLLTWLGFLLHLTGVVTRGLAAGRVPWGNMYEFSITSSLAVAVVYLLFVHRYKLQWLGLGVTLVIAAVLGLATLLLYTRTGSSSTCPPRPSPAVRSLSVR